MESALKIVHEENIFTQINTNLKKKSAKFGTKKSIGTAVNKWRGPIWH